MSSRVARFLAVTDKFVEGNTVLRTTVCSLLKLDSFKLTTELYVLLLVFSIVVNKSVVFLPFMFGLWAEWRIRASVEECIYVSTIQVLHTDFTFTGSIDSPICACLSNSRLTWHSQFVPHFQVPFQTYFLLVVVDTYRHSLTSYFHEDLLNACLSWNCVLGNFWLRDLASSNYQKVPFSREFKSFNQWHFLKLWRLR